MKEHHRTHVAVMDNMTSPGTLDSVLGKKKMRGGQRIGKQCGYVTDVYVHYVEKLLVIMGDIKKHIDK